ncbi:hypothetical protein [Saccharothrix violaceirubra]|uniref:Uncharacterized protein n=1 Tax=Saccharothrix violaceirubra TaxID=413306 RepID=A0A7W7TA97_9PSEU|nr:hypothetical protein [Saccharothrix violaceirubra]MBB4968937.1 hypothetical protein [Saccharothrix violaceirubra]
MIYVSGVASSNYIRVGGDVAMKCSVNADELEVSLGAGQVDFVLSRGATERLHVEMGRALELMRADN